jgi:hypothetical protein
MFLQVILFVFLAFPLGTQLSKEHPSETMYSFSHSLLPPSIPSLPECFPPHEYLPIVHFDKQPIVKGSLNGREVYFMIDSGSELSLLNAAEAKGFGFRISSSPAKSRNLSGLAGEGDRPYHLSQYEIRLGSQVLQGTFYAYPLEHLFSGKKDFKPVGIIGSKLLKAYGCSIDFKNQRLRININK